MTTNYVGAVPVLNYSAAGTGVAPSAPASGINSIAQILDSMEGQHSGVLHGVPSDYSWATYPVLGGSIPPSGMTAVTAWGQFYADSSNVHPANTRICVKNMECYLYSNSGHFWTRVQGVLRPDGDHYDEDFQGPGASASKRVESDGALSSTMIDGFNFHFFPVDRGFVASPSDVGAVYTTFQAKLILDNPAGADNRAACRYMANAGADWWRDLTIFYGDGTNNPGVGQARFTYLTNNYRAIDFYTGGTVAVDSHKWTQAQLIASSPPLDAMG